MKELLESMLTLAGWIVTLGVAVGPAISEELFCRGSGARPVRRFGTLREVMLHLLLRTHSPESIQASSL
jgi:hypothetical protein